MKKTLRLIIVLLILSICAPMAGARTFALVTGVSRYDIEDANLSQTAKDAKAFRELLLKQTPDVTILTSKYANRNNILEKLRAICNRARKGDRIIFFFSGHGSNGSLLTSDMKQLQYSDLIATLSDTEASEVICFIDACFAGSMAESTLQANAATSGLKPKDGHIYFVSCRADEKSAEAQWVGQGFFTQALLKGYRGKSDYDHDRKVTVRELFKYVHADVVRRSKKGQHPVLIAPKNMLDTVIVDWDKETQQPK